MITALTKQAVERPETHRFYKSKRVYERFVIALRQLDGERKQSKLNVQSKRVYERIVTAPPLAQRRSVFVLSLIESNSHLFFAAASHVCEFESFACFVQILLSVQFCGCLYFFAVNSCDNIA